MILRVFLAVLVLLVGVTIFWSRPYISPSSSSDEVQSDDEGVPTTALLTDGTRTILATRPAGENLEGGQDHDPIQFMAHEGATYAIQGHPPDSQRAVSMAP